MQRKQFHFSIENSDVETVVALSTHIPELPHPYGADEYIRRFDHTKHLILAAYSDKQAIGFKAGYSRDHYFYSWMGGVLPEFRRAGVARALAIAQESWARDQGYRTIRFKTRNRLSAMLQFGISSGFNIIAVEPKNNISEYRVVLEKEL